MLLVAWIVYFVVWGVSQQLLTRKINKVLIGVLMVISFADIIYLLMYDWRALILVILATLFAIMGVSKSIVTLLKSDLEGGE